MADLSKVPALEILGADAARHGAAEQVPAWTQWLGSPWIAGPIFLAGAALVALMLLARRGRGGRVLAAPRAPASPARSGTSVGAGIRRVMQVLDRGMPARRESGPQAGAEALGVMAFRTDSDLFEQAGAALGVGAEERQELVRLAREHGLASPLGLLLSPGRVRDLRERGPAHAQTPGVEPTAALPAGTRVG